MKIAVTSKGEGIKAKIDDRFGRCEYFVIVDTDTMDVKTIENEAKNEGSGAGGRAVRELSKNGVEVVIAPELGPKAVTAIKAFEVKAFKKGSYEIVEDVIKAYKTGKLEEYTYASVEEHAGLRRV
jgi:predicted Fe-Mo cluster-binding NifX family protein